MSTIYQSFISKSGVSILLLFQIFIPTTLLHAQQYNTLYWMQGIPQASYSNPGLQPRPGFYLGLPVISSYYYGLINTGFAPMDILNKNPDGSLYFDDESLLSSLNSKNYFVGEFQLDLLGFGFRSRRDYFSLNLTHKIGSNIGYPADLMTLLLRGNDYFLQQAVPADLSGLALNFAQYNELGFGYSRRWTDQLTVGIRAKVLYGLASVNFERNKFSFTTNPDDYGLLLKADLLVNKSFPIMLSPIDSLGKVGYEIEFDADPLDFATNRQNTGFAIDLGASYKINDLLTVAASMIDMGFINWKSHVENFAMNGEFEFRGIEFNDFFRNEQENVDHDPFEVLLDSIGEIFEIRESVNAYRTRLNTKVFASVAFHPGKAHIFALLGRGEFYYGNFFPSFTLSYNWNPNPQIGATLSYSLIHGNYNNVGFGLYRSIGPFKFFTVMDNFWGSFRPHTMQITTFHFGFNIVAGYRTKADRNQLSFR